jgi:hypothetical protein
MAEKQRQVFNVKVTRTVEETAIIQVRGEPGAKLTLKQVKERALSKYRPRTTKFKRGEVSEPEPISVYLQSAITGVDAKGKEKSRKGRMIWSIDKEDDDA